MNRSPQETCWMLTADWPSKYRGINGTAFPSTLPGMLPTSSITECVCKKYQKNVGPIQKYFLFEYETIKTGSNPYPEGFPLDWSVTAAVVYGNIHTAHKMGQVPIPKWDSSPSPRMWMSHKYTPPTEVDDHSSSPLLSVCAQQIRV